MFLKLKEQYSIKDYSTRGLQMSYGNVVDGEFKGIEYHHADTLSVDRIYDVIPYKYRQHFCLTLMKVNTAIPPHTDSGIKTAINFYLNTNNCLTQYYQPNDAARSSQVENQSDGYIYDETKLVRTDSFLAEPTDAYVLDVTVPHSVIPLGDIKSRTAFSLTTAKFSFLEVLIMLRQTGAV